MWHGLHARWALLRRVPASVYFAVGAVLETVYFKLLNDIGFGAVRGVTQHT